MITSNMPIAIDLAQFMAYTFFALLTGAAIGFAIALKVIERYGK